LLDRHQSRQIMLKEKHEFQLFSDYYYQFYLQDEQTSDGLADSWTDQACADLFAIALGTIGISTARNTGDVPVTVEIHTSEPTADLAEWNHVVAASIDLPSGKIVIAGCTDYFPDAARISVTPGIYQLRVFYAGLDSVSADGTDRYKVALWPGPSIEPQVIKRYVKN
jgi:hypothetical protein